MDVTGGNESVGYDAVFAVDSAVIQVKEALGLSVSYHVATVGIRRTALRFFCRRLGAFRFQSLLAVLFPVFRNVFVQFFQVIPDRLEHYHFIVLAPVGAGFQVGGIRIQNFAVHHFALHSLEHDFVKNFLVNATLVKTAPAVLAECTKMWNFVRQCQAEKPAICHIYFYFPNQLPFAANAEQVADEQHFEEQFRINSWTAIVGAIQSLHLLVDEAETDRPVYFSQKVLAWHEFFNAHQFNLCLLLGFAFDHEDRKTKSRLNCQDFVISLGGGVASPSYLATVQYMHELRAGRV